MLTISRNVARQIATIFRRALGLSVHQCANQLVLLQADAQGLVIQSATGSAAVEYHDPNPRSHGAWQAPLSLFKAVGGTKSDLVTLTSLADDQIQAHWQDGVVPRTGTWSARTEPGAPDFPAAPTSLIEHPPELLTALREAIATTDANPTRFALNCLRLRGSDGSIAATDGRQVFKHAGFDFGFADDVLFYPAGVFDSKDIPSNQLIGIGRTESHLVLRIGYWTFYQQIEKDRRFPRIEDVIPNIDRCQSTMMLPANDAAFLCDSLRRLPAETETNQPVTVDLNGCVAIRAQATHDAQPTELILSNSQREGAEIRLATDRTFLLRAAQLRFQAVHFTDHNTPAVCQDERRTYAWALLAKEGIVPPAEHATVIASPTAPETVSTKSRAVVPSTNPIPSQEPVPTMKNSPSATVARKTTPPQPTIPTPNGNSIEQALALRNQLRNLLTSTNELLRSLKRQKQQQRLMQSTLASLRQLQTVA